MKSDSNRTSDVNIANIVNRIKNNDKAAYVEFYDYTYKVAYSIAYNMMKNEEDTLDILQDSYVAAYNKIGTLQQPEKAASWFNMIVANKCRDYLKKKKPTLFNEIDTDDFEFEDTLENENNEFVPEEAIDYSETKRLMQQILEDLPEDQKLCTLMFYYEDLTVREIAESLECSENTVKSRLNYARKKIKEEVLALEKKGTKLYGIAPIPFIVWMLKGTESTYAATASLYGSIIAEVNAGAAAGTAVTGSTAATSSAVGTSGSAGTAASAGASATGSTGAAAAKGIAAVLAGKKIAAGIIALVVLVGGVAGGITVSKIQEKKEKAATVQAYKEYFEDKRSEITESVKYYDDEGTEIWANDLYVNVIDTDEDNVPEYVLYCAGGNGNSFEEQCKSYHLVTYLDGKIVDVPWQEYIIDNMFAGPTMEFNISEDGENCIIINPENDDIFAFEKNKKEIKVLDNKSVDDIADSYKKYTLDNCARFEDEYTKMYEFYVYLRENGIMCSLDAFGEKADSYLLYKPVLDQYMEAFRTGDAETGFFEIEGRTIYTIGDLSSISTGYQFYDVNDDGTDELFIGEMDGEGNSEFFDGYWHNGIINSLISTEYYSHLQLRIHKDTVVEDWSMWPAHIIEYQKFDEDGELYEAEELCVTDKLDDSGATIPGQYDYTHSVDGEESQKITLSELKEIQAGYGDPMNLELIPFGGYYVYLEDTFRPAYTLSDENTEAVDNTVVKEEIDSDNANIAKEGYYIYEGSSGYTIKLPNVYKDKVKIVQENGCDAFCLKSLYEYNGNVGGVIFMIMKITSEEASDEYYMYDIIGSVDNGEYYYVWQYPSDWGNMPSEFEAEYYEMAEYAPSIAESFNADGFVNGDTPY